MNKQNVIIQIKIEMLTCESMTIADSLSDRLDFDEVAPVNVEKQ